jgi:hypothetical protein
MTTSIHNDATAHKVGMRGGTIPGTIHLSLFAPLMLQIFGKRWFETGNLSLYYTFATTDLEEVRAVVKMPSTDAKDIQMEARVEMRDGKVVAKGTIAVGEPKELSYIQALELKNSDPDELRILAGFKVGGELRSRDIVFTQEQVDKGLPAITDHIDYYKGKSPWGNSILSPTAMYNFMALGSYSLDAEKVQAVPFYGATEIRNINGPVLIGVPYESTGKIICVGVSKRTEYFWHDSFLKEKESGKLVATIRHMNRFMKAGSPLYKENK